LSASTAADIAWFLSFDTAKSIETPSEPGVLFRFATVRDSIAAISPPDVNLA
jgi:hypothetical protein